MPVFLYSTRAFIQGDCQNIIAKKLTDKGFYTIGKISFNTPSNGVYIYEKPDHGRYKHVRFEKGIVHKIEKFVNKTIIKYTLFMKKPFSGVGMILPFYNILRFISHKLYGKKYCMDLKINSNCNNCKLCVSLCPEKNLIDQDNHVIVKESNGCLRCLRCVCHCAQNAISFTSSTQIARYTGSVMKDLYWKTNN
jgi:ferredoxin